MDLLGKHKNKKQKQNLFIRNCVLVSRNEFIYFVGVGQWSWHRNWVMSWRFRSENRTYCSKNHLGLDCGRQRQLSRRATDSGVSCFQLKFLFEFLPLSCCVYFFSFNNFSITDQREVGPKEWWPLSALGLLLILAFPRKLRSILSLEEHSMFFVLQYTICIAILILATPNKLPLQEISHFALQLKPYFERCSYHGLHGACFKFIFLLKVWLKYHHIAICLKICRHHAQYDKEFIWCHARKCPFCGVRLRLHAVFLLTVFKRKKTIFEWSYCITLGL